MEVTPKRHGFFQKLPFEKPRKNSNDKTEAKIFAAPF